MEARYQILLIFYSLGLLVLIWQFTRRGLFRPAYALLWLLTGLFFLFFSIFRQLVPILAEYFQVSYPPSLIFAGAIGFLTIILIHHTVLLSMYSNKNKDLAQDIAILEWRLEQLEKYTDQPVAIDAETSTEIENGVEPE